MRILGISGSLRDQSKNTVALRGAAGVVLFEELGLLPHFNPDLDVEPFPEAVVRWRAALLAADAVVISSPEYAHGVPGVLKNALDWVVGSGEFMHKPVALVDLGGRSEFVYVQLAEILKTMMAEVVVVRNVGEAALSFGRKFSGRGQES